MILNGKIEKIVCSNSGKQIYFVFIRKSKKFGKKTSIIDIAVTFHRPLLVQDIKENKIRPGMRVDIQFWMYSKEKIFKGRAYADSYIVAERWREYKKGRKNEMYVGDPETGEIICKRKGVIPVN